MSNHDIPSPFQGTQKAQLSINQVIGTSAKSSNQFAIQGDVIAYTASGGVVVCKVDKEQNSIVSQRFFCANTSSNGQVSENDMSSANAYLNMAMNNRSNESVGEIRKDSFGFSLNIEPITYNENNGSIGSDYGINLCSGNDVETSSPSKLKDRVRSINCINISPNKRVLAVGEIGYQPRILLYSLAQDSNPWPIASISEHSFGINTICFSPDSKYLCSLGLVNDGFINIWKFTSTSITLQASNKCSSILNQVLWHENYIVTIGLRLIKVWEFCGDDIGNNKSKVLKGKNVLLGPMINSNFIRADILNNDEVLMVDDTSRLLLLKLNYMNLKLIPLKNLDFNIYSIWIDHESDMVWFGSESSSIRSAKLGDLKADTSKNLQPANPSSPNKERTKKYPILSLSGFNTNNLIILTNNEEITLFDKIEKEEKVLTSSLIKNLSGTKYCFSKDIAVFSESGVVRIINEDDILEEVIDFNLPSTEMISNTLNAVDMSNRCLILGDKIGNLYILDSGDDKKYTLVYQTKAHSSSINEISYFKLDKYEIIVSIARDRMIQIFYKDENGWDILQTIPIHNANLLQVQYHKEKIYVSSSDRTISVHKLDLQDGKIKVYQEKIITLKSSPVYMSLYDDNLIVSTNDKNIFIFNIEDAYEQKRSLKLFNEKTNESLQVEMFAVFNSSLIASSSDKSLRVFNFFTGKELSVAWGQSEPILSLVLKGNDEFLSISNDGCLFKWNIQSSTESVKVEKTDEAEEYTLPLYTKVTRKIIPTSPLKNTSSPTRFSQALQINSNGPDSTDKLYSPLSTPTSPTPKLTAATLKRIEARNKLNGIDNNKKQASPTKPKTPLRPLQRSLSPVKPHAFVSKNTTNSNISSASNVSPGRPYLRKGSEYRSPSPVINNELDRCLNELSSVETYLQRNQISAGDKSKIYSKVKSIMDILNPEEKLIDNISKMKLSDDINTTTDNNGTDRMLENYSEKLIKLVEEKLSHYILDHQDTPSKMQK